jgi:hypothetical protein
LRAHVALRGLSRVASISRAAWGQVELLDLPHEVDEIKLVARERQAEEAVGFYLQTKECACRRDKAHIHPSATSS